jgi:hypothetical protein
MCGRDSIIGIAADSRRTTLLVNLAHDEAILTAVGMEQAHKEFVQFDIVAESADTTVSSTGRERLLNARGR